MNGRLLWSGCVAGLCAVCLLAGLVPLARAQSQAGKPEKAEQQKPEAGKADEIRPPPRYMPAIRFETTVFQVAVPKDRIADLDAKKLAAAGPTAAQLAKALQQFGATEVLYRVDQVIPADGRRNEISVTRDTPYATAPQSSEGSTPLARERVGTKFGVMAFAPEDASAQRVQAALDIEIATLTPSRVQLGPDVAAPVFWRVQQKYGGATELGQPVVLLSVDGAATAGSDQTLAFVSLVTLSTAGK